eukprot:1784127-Ditylum_brightwellii.AAC.1
MQSSNTTLGGGANGHLVLVCDLSTYASIPGTTSYVRPAHPGPLAIPGEATQFQIVHACEHYQESLHLFQEVTNVKRTLIQQIVKTVDAKYLTAIRNPVTNKITRTIPAIFAYLFYAYEVISPDQLQELQSIVKNYHFDPYEPVDTLYTEINSFADLATIAHSPVTDQQKIGYVYLALQHT